MSGSSLIDLHLGSSDKYKAFFRASNRSPSTILDSTTAVKPAQFQIVTLRDTGSRWEFYVDGILEASTPVRGEIVPDPILIGNHFDGNNGFTGHISEILIYDTAQSAGDFADTLKYLQRTYGLTLAIE